MNWLFKFIILISLVFISNCSEKVTYSGKIFDKNFNYENVKNKNDLIEKIGLPNFTDFIENKFYYYSEKRISKNFFDNKIVERNIIVYNFDQDGNILSVKDYELKDDIDVKYIKEITENDIIERGLIEKLFGGVGKKPLNNTP